MFLTDLKINKILIVRFLEFDKNHIKKEYFPFYVPLLYIKKGILPLLWVLSHPIAPCTFVVARARC